jgi:transcriptional regulator NrdR family protein
MNNLTCPKCGGDTGVIDTRQPKNFNTIRRRRMCFRCSYRYSTYEVDDDTYNTLFGIAKNLGKIRTDVQYLLDRLNTIIENGNNEQFSEPEYDLIQSDSEDTK